MALPTLLRKLFKNDGYGSQIKDERLSPEITVQDWSNAYDYPANVFAKAGGEIYRSVAASGPGTAAGAKDPAQDDGTYWVNETDVVHKSGDEIITGDKHCRAISLYNNGITKGTNPSSAAFTGFVITDKNKNTENSGRLAVLESFIDTDGTSTLRLAPYQFTSGSATRALFDVNISKTGATSIWTGCNFEMNRPYPILELNSSGTSSNYCDIRFELNSAEKTKMRCNLDGGFFIENTISSTLSNTLSLVANGDFYLQGKSGSTVRQFRGNMGGTLTWLGNTIQTSSDERIKTQIRNVPDSVLDAWDSVQWGEFQFLDAVSEKGANARMHVGLVAQSVERACAQAGTDILRYGILCHEDREAVEHEDGTREDAVELWMVRYAEALCMEAAYQRRRADRAEARIASLEARLAALEAKLNG